MQTDCVSAWGAY